MGYVGQAMGEPVGAGVVSEPVVGAPVVGAPVVGAGGVGQPVGEPSRSYSPSISLLYNICTSLTSSSRVATYKPSIPPAKYLSSW